MNKKKKWFDKSTILNALLLVFVILMLVSPTAKSYVIRGLMKVGLFQPSVPATAAAKAPSMTFKDSYDKLINIEELKGKVVILNFWATWCPPCRAELPSLQTLYEKNNNEAVFITVDADRKLSVSKKFMDDNGYSLPVFKTMSDIPATIYDGTLPTTLVIDKRGNIRARYTGAKDYTNGKFETFLQSLLAE
ncbi:Thiol-disulfide isomerase or thioredoxin [Chitinophaga jiangningensis]|uniref:Thiol-disulfide isomerase or thioredoxin n=1 Tax=Chitinophaga jiangningensis TaxID=1419482 RepID=A0A1M7AP91_9BACT|nr:TlpA disulfide reductase family protein [Chitinophaga jiangningensis]SHL44572.1 Thiol-disulfide isomerase or thioredoxin [Chitinophaga jiangningensis]